MSLITYPRTAAELHAVLALGYKEVLKMLRDNKLRVNLRNFLSFLFKSQQYDDKTLDAFNQRLLGWQDERRAAGLPDAALVYHHSGVRILPGFTFESFTYVKKANRVQYLRERKTEFIKARRDWLKELAKTREDLLLKCGIPLPQIDLMKTKGRCPVDCDGKPYQVHHRKPLDDGGTNDPANFILIRDDVEHRAVHGHYNPAEQSIDRLTPGRSAVVALPMPPADTFIYPNPDLKYLSEKVANVELLSIYDDY